jgi:hypothetical protein
MRSIGDESVILEELLVFDPYELLAEDLGKLRQLGLGRMINAFKQSYHMRLRRRGREVGPTENAIGKTIRNSGTMIGQNSDSIDCGHVQNMLAVKRNIKKTAGPHGHEGAGIVFYVDGKAVMLIVGTIWQMEKASNVMGISWDFTGTSMTPQDFEAIVKNNYGLHGAASSHGYYHKSDSRITKPDPLKSRASYKNVQDGYGKKEDTYKIEHYEGVALDVRTIRPFIDDIAAFYKGKLQMKIITQDTESIKKRHDRYSNYAEKRFDSKDWDQVRKFKEDLKVRLQKYKNDKLKTVPDVKEFIQKVFSSGGKGKITFAGQSYTLTPSSYSSNIKPEIFTNGKTFTLAFEADRVVQQYSSLYIKMKIQNMQLVPIEAEYEEDGRKRRKYSFEQDKFID